MESIYEGMVTVSLQNGPEGSSLRCSDEAGFVAQGKDGLATFEGFFLEEALRRGIFAPFFYRFESRRCINGPSTQNLTLLLDVTRIV